MPRDAPVTITSLFVIDMSARGLYHEFLKTAQRWPKQENRVTCLKTALIEQIHREFRNESPMPLEEANRQLSALKSLVDGEIEKKVCELSLSRYLLE